MKNILSTNNFRTGAAWVFLVLGIILYIVGFFVYDVESVQSRIAIKIADVLVIGVVLGFVTNAAQFIGIFKQDLQDVIYGRDLLKQRKDLYPIWENLSKELFKNKFPTIHKELLKTINSYLPNDEVSYYNDYEIHTTIEWINKEEGIIKATDKVSFDLISDTIERIPYPIKNWTYTIDNKQYSNNITQIIVNDHIYNSDDLLFVSEKRESEGGLCIEQQIFLQGCTKYDIKYTREKTYNINDDYYVGFRAKFIVNKLRVCLDLPDDIDAIFTCRGTQKDFDDVTNTSNRIEKRYRGIVLPRQGYVFALKQKKIMTKILSSDMEG